jgi:CheY-like chemotaxis protein
LQTAAEALRSGAFDYLPQPVSRPVLIKVVANAAQVKALRTEKKRLERDNRRHRDELERLVGERTQQIQALFANLPGVVYRVRVEPSGEETVLYVGGRSERWLELSADDLRRDVANLYDLIEPRERARFAASRAEARAAQGQWHFEGRFRLKSGRVTTLRLVAQLSLSRTGEQMWDVLVMDVSEQRELEAQVLLSDRMASVGTLTAGLAHDINNPLSALSSDLEVLAEELSAQSRHLPAEVSQELSRIVKGARQGTDHIARIVRDLRTFSRASEDRLVSLDVRDVVESSIRLAMNEIRHRARLERDYGEAPAVRGNESRLVQVILNLLIELARAIPEGHADAHTIVVRVRRREGGQVAIEISGSFDRALGNSTFRPPVGEGLVSDARTNLYVCHSIVTALGGQLSRTHTLEGRVSFEVLLPESPQEPVPRSSQGGSERPPAAKARLLVVDDDPLMLKALRRALRGHDIETVSSGRHAVTMLESDRRFDLILCDVMMPDLTGVDVYAAAQTLEPGLEERIVFITGGAFTPQASEFMARIPNRRLNKPFSAEAVRATVEDMMNEG